VAKCKPGNIAKVRIGSPVLGKHLDTRSRNLSTVGSAVPHCRPRALSEQQGAYFVMHQERVTVPWRSTVPMLKRETQIVRDSLEPANERRTAFGEMYDDSWVSLNFIIVWDFPRHLELLGTLFSPASSGTMMCHFPGLLSMFLMVMTGKRQFNVGGGNLFPSDMGRNTDLKVFSSKGGKAIWV